MIYIKCIIFAEGFKDSIKKFGKTAALSGMLGLASLGAMSCSDPSSNDDVCNHNYVFVDENGDGVIDDEDWIDGIKPDADHIGKKHRNCSKCNLSDVVDDASKFVSHKKGCNSLMDPNGYIRCDVDENGIDDDWYGDDVVYKSSGKECLCNSLAKDINDSHYGKKHKHRIGMDDDKNYVDWDMDGDEKYEKQEGPYPYKKKDGTIIN